MTESSLTPLLIVVGSFYIVAGIVGARAVLMDALLDKAITALALKTRKPLDVERSVWMLAVACVVGSSGALLAAGSNLALPAFLLSSLMQALHFLELSPKRYDVEEPVSPEGRQKSLNAYLLYLIVTAFVAWVTLAGYLSGLAGWNIYVFTALGVGWLLACTWSIYQLLTLDERRTMRAGLDAEVDEGDAAAEQEALQQWAKTVQIILVPSCAATPLIDAESNEALHHLDLETLNLPGPLKADLAAYSAECQQIIDPHDPLMKPISGSEKASELLNSGERLFLKLQKVFGERVNFEREFRPNLPKRIIARLDVVGCPWTTGLFDNWPEWDNQQYVCEQEIWPNTLGISLALMNDISGWVHETHDLYTFDPRELRPEATSDRLAKSVSLGRSLAIRFAKEFSATGRGNIPITYYPFDSTPEDIKQ